MTTRNVVPAAITLLLCGCGGGGGGGGGGTGRAALTVNWPTRSRMIPKASESVKVELVSGGTVVGSGIIVRPAAGGSSSITLENLPSGTLMLNGTAHPNANGTGTAQASGSVPITITSGQTAQHVISLETTITRMELIPVSVTLDKGQTQQLNASAWNSTGQTVLISAATMQWESTNSAATVNSTGLVTAANPGLAQVRITETESGKQASVSVAVNLIVTVTPPSATLSVTDSQAFTAVVEGSANQTVTWSIQEGAAGGTITSGGVYTAPSLPGTYHAVATSQADSTRKATAAITVQSGNASGVIQ